MRDGDMANVVVSADALLATTEDLKERTWALLLRLAAVINLERSSEYTSTVDRAYAAVREHGGKVATGYFHALAAFTAHADGSIERCVTHLVQSTRSLSEVEQPARMSAVAWHNLAVVFSYIGFHEHAAQAAARARETAASAQLGWTLSEPEVQVRHGLSLDHRGDTDGCVRVLRALLSDISRLATHDDALPGVARIDLPWIGYAAARLRALGHDTQLDHRRCLAAGGNDAWTADLRHFGRICMFIADGEPDEARRRLGRATSSAAVLGVAEAPRLRALSHLSEGDYAAAYQADRETFAMHARANDQVRRLYIDGVAARLDHENLRRTSSADPNTALTDPLTGLPNRRHLLEQVDELVKHNEPAVLGLIDLEGFRHINTEHGQLSGDAILQRTAGVLMRIMRRGDFVARYGADEFVLVLPHAQVEETADIGCRISAALHAEDWQALVPGVDPTVNIGWASLSTTPEAERGTSVYSRADHAVQTAREARVRHSR